MHIFGGAWENHPARIEQTWRETVNQEDLVLIPGDVSWAMRLPDARDDLAFIGSLPGTKLLLRGNHDYWWSSVSKVRAFLPEGCFALQNDAFFFGDFAIAGSRGWTCPGSVSFTDTDRAIYDREVIRLGLSLDAAGSGRRLIAMLHFPPFNERRIPSGFTELIEAHGAEALAYGHLHDKACASAFEGMRGGTNYMLCSADHLNFIPRLVAEG